MKLVNLYEIHNTILSSSLRIVKINLQKVFWVSMYFFQKIYIYIYRANIVMCLLLFEPQCCI